MRIESHPATTAAALSVVAACFTLVSACGDSSPNQSNDTPGKTTTYRSEDNYAPFDYEPSFEPDYNNLTAQPWVMPVTPTQSDAADVFADRLEFPDTASEVATWLPGRLIVGAPSSAAGNNALGFARRVVSVEHVGGKYVVTTSVPAIEDILQGDFQMQMKPEELLPVDLGKADLQWMADNLYTLPTAGGPGTPLTDDHPLEQMPLGFWGDVGDFFGGAAEAIAGAALDVWRAITPASISASFDITPTIVVADKATLFAPMKYTKEFTTSSGIPYSAFISGTGGYDVSVTMNPGIQIGARLGFPGHNVDSEFWLNIDASLNARIKVNFEMEAGLESYGGQPAINVPNVDLQGALAAAKAKIMGDPDLKASAPPGGWKKVLWLSKPKMQFFFVGPIPVVLTETLQVNLECGFQAKGSIKANVDIREFHTFKYKISTSGSTSPAHYRNSSKIVQVTGGGGLTVSCGIVPRVNVFLYDMVGVFAGVRGSLVASVGYHSKCANNPTEHRPTGVVDLGLWANIGLQGGIRLQAPGSSFAGAGPGLETAFDFWSKNFPLLTEQWTFPAEGFGYCTPTCQNGAFDPTTLPTTSETDIDCGGPCTACETGKECAVNSDCVSKACLPAFASDGTATGKKVCATNYCGNGVSDSTETDIDCGGPNCYTCAAGQRCNSAGDCASTFCTAFVGEPRTCVDDHCVDGLKDGNEGGIDCGGPTCAKCALGAAATTVSDCASGFFNGSICVATACVDLLKSSGESDVDCGGDTCAQRCYFQQSCWQTSDCADGRPCHPTLNRCVKTNGESCTSNIDCHSSTCQANVCAPANNACTNGVQDGAETDLDCGGPSCNSCGVTRRCMIDTDCTFGNCTPQPGLTGGRCTVPLDVLAAWPFDGNGDDVSGNGYTAVLQNNAGFTTQAHSGARAASFSASNAWVEVATMDLGDTYTITGWLFVPDLVQSLPIVGNVAQYSPGNGFQLHVNGARLGLGTGDGSENICTYLSTADVLTANTWQHVAVTIDRTAGTVVLYHNGVAVPATTNGSCSVGGLNGSFSTNKGLVMGGFGGAPSGSGSLDDIRVYDSVLSATGIAAIATQ